MHINFLMLPQLLKTTLIKNGVSTVEHLTAHNRGDLLGLMGIGELSVKRIEAALMRRGLILGANRKEYWSDHGTMFEDKPGRSAKKEVVLTSTAVEGYLAWMLRKKANEQQAKAELFRAIAQTYSADNVM